MNFHKTIGFLAALLLMVGLGAPDSFAQETTVKVSKVTPESIREGQTSTVTVEVTLSKAPGENSTSTVTVSLPDLTVVDFTVRHGPDANNDGVPDNDGFPNVEISGTATKGTAVATVTVAENAVYNHPRRKAAKFSLTGDVNAATTGNDSLVVVDNDEPIGPLNLSINPPSVDTQTPTSVKVKVTLDKAPGKGDLDDDPDTPDEDITVTVNFTATNVDGTPITLSNDDASKNIVGSAKTITTTVSVPSSIAGVVKVVAKAVDYTDGTISIPVIERDANDATGYRVLLTNPANNAWVGVGDRKVTVEVVRADRIAYPWTEFSSIAVSLADTLVKAGDPLSPVLIYTLTASSFSKANGDLTFSRERKDGSTVDTDATFGGNKKNDISYNEGADKLTFKFRLNALADGGGSGTVLGDILDNNDRAGEDAESQRTAIYAVVTFKRGATTVATLNNRSNKKITNTSTVAVGDGNLIRIDLKAPTHAERTAFFPTAPVVRINGKSAVTGKKGDLISVAVEKNDKRLRTGKVQISINSIANTDMIGSAKTLGLKTWTFDVLDVIDAQGDSLRASIKVEDLNAQNTQNPRDPGVGKDGQKTKKNSKYEPDNLQMEARLVLIDQANNKSPVGGDGSVNAKSAMFRADPRAPVISVLHPTSDSPHFSGRNRNTIDEAPGINFDKHLNPLELRADEKLDSLFVYIKGAKSERLDLLNGNAGRSKVTKAFTRPTYFTEGAWGDTTSYDTRGLKWKNAKGEAKGTGQGGRTVDLVIDAHDLVGNKTSVTLAGVHHDQVVPTITDFFPKNSLLADNTINNSTRHPSITLKEAVDSLSVVYDPSSGADIVVKMENLAKDDYNVAITKDFEANKTYTLTIFARDLAGNVFVTAEDSARAMKFDASFPNPIANHFKVTAKHDSMIAGRPNPLTIQAFDKHATDDSKDREVVTYRNDGAQDVIIVAMDAMGETASSVRFSGKGVNDNGDGTGSLNADNWALGSRKVDVTSNATIDNFTVKVKHRIAGDGGTAVVSFSGEQDSLYVDAADFRKIVLTAWEDGEDVDWVWGDFNLKMVPTDAHGNPSMKTYLNDEGAKDSLSVLDTRVTKDRMYKDGVDIRLQATPAVGGLLSEVWGVGEEGYTLSVTAPDKRGSSLVIQARVLNSSLKGVDDATRDTRSENLRGSLSLTITPNLMPVLTVWDSGGNDVTGQDVVVPIGGSTTVTARVAGFMAGSSVTFTKDGTAMAPVTANASGQATLSVTGSAAGTVTVSAASGQDNADAITITFVKQSRKEYADAEGNAVFLVYTGDSPPDLTVDMNDFQAFAAAYPSSEGDDNYNVQADIDGDGDVDLEDFLAFANSWNRTAAGPSTKPLVLLPGINENAEFSLRLGSERVIPGELIALDVALANVQALVGYGFVLHYDADKFEFVSVAPAAEDLLKSTGGETPLFQHWVTDGQVAIANSVINGTAVSGGGDIVRLTFRVLKEFEENARFEVADGLVFDPQQLSNLAVVAGVLELQSTPMEFALHQNFPNPFNPDTTIKYELAESADVTLLIYNVLGQVVRTLVLSDSQPPGRYQIRWNGMDDRGVSVSSGVYFYRISAEGKFHDVRKLMLLK